MKFSFKYNGIVTLKSGDSRIEDVVDIKNIAFNHFKERFQEQNLRRPKLERWLLMLKRLFGALI